jgi:hypothetical protein
MGAMRAIVEWIPEEHGGRQQPPTGVGSRPYTTVVHFPDAKEPWPAPVGWSLVVEKDEALSERFRWVANVYFLVGEAPHDALRPGRAFELYEGNKRVAHGRILSESESPAVPPQE